MRWARVTAAARCGVIKRFCFHCLLQRWHLIVLAGSPVIFTPVLVKDCEIKTNTAMPTSVRVVSGMRCVVVGHSSWVCVFCVQWWCFCLCCVRLWSVAFRRPHRTRAGVLAVLCRGLTLLRVYYIVCLSGIHSTLLRLAAVWSAVKLLLVCTLVCQSANISCTVLWFFHTGNVNAVNCVF